MGVEAERLTYILSTQVPDQGTAHSRLQGKNRGGPGQTPDLSPESGAQPPTQDAASRLPSVSTVSPSPARGLLLPFSLLPGSCSPTLGPKKSAFSPAGRLMPMAGFPEAAPKARSVESNQGLGFL